MLAHKLLSSFILKDVEIICNTDKPDIRVFRKSVLKSLRLAELLVIVSAPAPALV